MAEVTQLINSLKEEMIDMHKTLNHTHSVEEKQENKLEQI